MSIKGPSHVVARYLYSEPFFLSIPEPSGDRKANKKVTGFFLQNKGGRLLRVAFWCGGGDGGNVRGVHKKAQRGGHGITSQEGDLWDAMEGLRDGATFTPFFYPKQKRPLFRDGCEGALLVWLHSEKERDRRQKCPFVKVLCLCVIEKDPSLPF